MRMALIFILIVSHAFAKDFCSKENLKYQQDSLKQVVTWLLKEKESPNIDRIRGAIQNRCEDACMGQGKALKGCQKECAPFPD